MQKRHKIVHLLISKLKNMICYVCYCKDLNNSPTFDPQNLIIPGGIRRIFTVYISLSNSICCLLCHVEICPSYNISSFPCYMSFFLLGHITGFSDIKLASNKTLEVSWCPGNLCFNPHPIKFFLPGHMFEKHYGGILTI